MAACQPLKDGRPHPEVVATLATVDVEIPASIMERSSELWTCAGQGMVVYCTQLCASIDSYVTERSISKLPHPDDETARTTSGSAANGIGTDDAEYGHEARFMDACICAHVNSSGRIRA